VLTNFCDGRTDGQDEYNMLSPKGRDIKKSLFLQLFYILKGNSLKLSKLAYCYHTKNRISLRQFDRTILTELLSFTNISPKCCIRKYTLQNYACLPFTIRIFAWFPRSSVKPFPKECPMGVRNQSNTHNLRTWR
jgi:hypothetical protein